MTMRQLFSRKSRLVQKPLGWTPALCFIAISAISLVGCWSRLPPGKVHIRGLVTLDDRPLTFGGEGIFSVTLVAVTGSESMGAKLDKSSGKFSMVLSPGDYTAVVVATDGFGEEPGPGKVVAPKSLIPERYGNLPTSGVTIHVPQRGGNVTIPLYRSASTTPQS